MGIEETHYWAVDLCCCWPGILFHHDPDASSFGSVIQRSAALCSGRRKEYDPGCHLPFLPPPVILKLVSEFTEVRDDVLSFPKVCNLLVAMQYVGLQYVMEMTETPFLESGLPVEGGPWGCYRNI